MSFSEAMGRDALIRLEALKLVIEFANDCESHDEDDILAAADRFAKFLAGDSKALESYEEAEQRKMVAQADLAELAVAKARQS